MIPKLVLSEDLGWDPARDWEVTLPRLCFTQWKKMDSSAIFTLGFQGRDDSGQGRDNTITEPFHLRWGAIKSMGWLTRPDVLQTKSKTFT